MPRFTLGEVDAWQRCYPTWAGDVAKVLKGMTEMHLSGESLQGFYHWQGPSETCKTKRKNTGKTT